jgi:hypothetical protein
MARRTAVVEPNPSHSRTALSPGTTNSLLCTPHLILRNDASTRLTPYHPENSWS